jgi:hypothetical protein
MRVGGTTSSVSWGIERGLAIWFQEAIINYMDPGEHKKIPIFSLYQNVARE